MAIGFALVHRERNGRRAVPRCVAGGYLLPHARRRRCRFCRCAATSFVPRATVRCIRAAAPPASIISEATNTFRSMRAHGASMGAVVPRHGMPNSPPTRVSKTRADGATTRLDCEVIEDWLSQISEPRRCDRRIDKERVPCAPVLTVNEAVKHPHLNERKMSLDGKNPLLGSRHSAVPVKFSAWPDQESCVRRAWAKTMSECYANCSRCRGIRFNSFIRMESGSSPSS